MKPSLLVSLYMSLFVSLFVPPNSLGRRHQSLRGFSFAHCQRGIVALGSLVYLGNGAPESYPGEKPVPNQQS